MWRVMVRKSLLESIWDGSITALPAGADCRIAREITRLVRVPVLSLGASRPMGDLRVWPEALELMPGVTLGDVLAEELGLDVPYGALVVVEATEGAAAGRMDLREIEALIDRAMQHFVVSPEAGAARSAAEAGEGQLFTPRGLFRDPGLNARFFQRPKGQPRDAERHRAAG